MHVSAQPPVAWYRQFWPWFLIALPATVVAASIVTLIIAIRTHDPLPPAPAEAASGQVSSNTGVTSPTRR